MGTREDVEAYREARVMGEGALTEGDSCTLMGIGQSSCCTSCSEPSRSGSLTGSV